MELPARKTAPLLAAVICLLLAAVQTARAQAAIDTYLGDVQAELKKRYPHNRIITIVCHGHSVPAGYFRSPEVRSLEAYPHVLRRMLAQAFPTAVVNVIVTASGGENSITGEVRF